MDKKNWLDYWNEKNIWLESDLLKRNTEIFYQKTTNIFNYDKKHVVLEIGCGTGDLANKISNKVSKIYCLDTSLESIKVCKNNISKKKNVKILKLNNDYTNLSFLKNAKFSIIIANSVVEYYRSQVEIINLVKSVKKIAMKDARFLISDIVVTRDKIKKYPKLIYNSISNGYFIPLMKMSLRFIFDKKYSNFQKNQPSLIVNIDKLIEDLSVFVKNITIVNENLTINPNRKHLLVQF
jgi:ubiquinone/menaquinone biosynthesis C-methylase UbiE|tara:strand:- start:156 stop:866 length:711 start_codon:yes stop_codon:yes gene_type:complete